MYNVLLTFSVMPHSRVRNANWKKTQKILEMAIYCLIIVITSLGVSINLWNNSRLREQLAFCSYKEMDLAFISALIPSNCKPNLSISYASCTAPLKLPCNVHVIVINVLNFKRRPLMV
jgi:hypothetical protein